MGPSGRAGRAGRRLAVARTRASLADVPRLGAGPRLYPRHEFLIPQLLSPPAPGEKAKTDRLHLATGPNRTHGTAMHRAAVGGVLGRAGAWGQPLAAADPSEGGLLLFCWGCRAVHEKETCSEQNKHSCEFARFTCPSSNRQLRVQNKPHRSKMCRAGVWWPAMLEHTQHSSSPWHFHDSEYQQK